MRRRQIAALYEKGSSMADDKPDIARLIDEAAKAIGLPIAPEYREKVILNYERSMAIARPLLEVELDDELTSAPVFRP
jgi:1-carboxybiuret hydrolase subunit AtzG-like protein